MKSNENLHLVVVLRGCLFTMRDIFFAQMYFGCLKVILRGFFSLYSIFNIFPRLKLEFNSRKYAKN